MASANEDTGYYLTCRKCKNDGDVGVCTDGIWFFDSKVLENAGPVGSLYCCSKCIVWFRRNSRNWFQDDLQRSWLRYTKKDVCTWPCNSWRSSIQRTDEFVLHFSRLENQKKTSKSTEKKLFRPTLLKPAKNVNVVMSILWRVQIVMLWNVTIRQVPFPLSNTPPK